jgi:hypothetical protein
MPPEILCELTNWMDTLTFYHFILSSKTIEQTISSIIPDRKIREIVISMQRLLLKAEANYSLSHFGQILIPRFGRFYRAEGTLTAWISKYVPIIEIQTSGDNSFVPFSFIIEVSVSWQFGGSLKITHLSIFFCSLLSAPLNTRFF